MRRRAAWVAAAIVPFAGVALGARAIVPRVGDAMAGRIASVASGVRGTATVTVTATATGGAPATPWASSAAVAVSDPPPKAPKALVIRADRVARLTAKQLRGIHASDAVDASGKPVGARLSGVSALGLGLADGDVVTSIAGRATPTADEAIAAATGAYASGARAVSATVVRGTDTIAVTVEMPAGDAGARGREP